MSYTPDPFYTVTCNGCEIQAIGNLWYSKFYWVNETNIKDPMGWMIDSLINLRYKVVLKDSVYTAFHTIKYMNLIRKQLQQARDKQFTDIPTVFTLELTHGASLTITYHYRQFQQTPLERF